MGMNELCKLSYELLKLGQIFSNINFFMLISIYQYIYIVSDFLNYDEVINQS